MIRFILFLSGIWIFTCATVLGQDIHFSQYFANPLYLNPAATGGYNGAFRVHANYRNQWFTVSDQPYVTYAGGADVVLLKNKLRFDQLGIGLLVYSDRAGAGLLVNQSVLLSVAYHKVLDEMNKYSLSAGIQGGIGQKRIDFSRLTFEEQFDRDLNQFNTAIFNGENVADNNILYPDINAGLQFKARFSPQVTSYVGFSYGHINRPKESFLVNDADNRLSPRSIVHVGTDIKMGKYVTLTPGLMFMNQRTAQQITFGSAVGFSFTPETALFLGAWYRLNDALIPMIAYEFKGFRVGLSYDVNTSDLQPASNSNGAAELSLVYIHGLKNEPNFSPARYCPRF